MAKTVDELHELLHNLTAAEKRYVKIFASKHNLRRQSSYLRLFDALLSVSEYNKAALKNLLPNIDSLSADKAYLHSFVLKAMRSFHEEKTVDTQLRELMISSSFLYEKRLYSQALRLLGKAKKLAQQYDKSTMLLEILFLQSRNVIEKQSQKQKILLDEIHNQAALTLQQLNEEWPLIRRQQSIFLLFRSRYQLRSPEMRSLLDEVCPPGALSKVTPPIRFTPAYYYYFSTALYYQCQGKLAESADAYEQLLQLWERHPHKQEEASMQHKKNLSNYLSVCLSLGRFERFPVIMKQIVSIPCSNPEEEAEQFQNVRFTELQYLINTDGFDRLDELTNIIQAGLIRYRTKINKARELAFYHNISIAYFLLHKWSEATKWIEKILRIDRTEHRTDIQNFARVLRLVLLYEMNKHDLLEYELINTERFLRSKKSWFLFESTIVRHLKKLLETETSRKKEQFEKLSSFLNKTISGAEGPIILGSSELHFWCRSSIDNVGMRDLLRSEISMEGKVTPK